MARREPLAVWMDGIAVAELTSRRPGEVRCQYTDEALDRWPGNVPLLSCSLPLSNRRVDARTFFSGLLPEGRHRQAMAALARVPSFDTFGMLERFGRDVAGALVISREGPDARSGSVKPYTPSSLAAEVAQLPEHPLGLHDDSELSIAGLQDKMLLVSLPDGGWGRPVHGAPSTHILKVEDRRYPGMADAEAACLRLGRAVGLTTVDASVETIADLPCLIVSRFDRVAEPTGKVERVHQEDACQALGRDPEAQSRRGKYEDAGGPALREIATLLDRYAVDGPHQLGQLAAAVTFTVCIGNADAHGKNLALLHPRAENVELAPLYDTLPTALWPQLRTAGAMSINGTFDLARVEMPDVVAEAVSWRMSAAMAADVVRSTAAAIVEAGEQLDAPEALARFVTERARRLLASESRL